MPQNSFTRERRNREEFFRLIDTKKEPRQQANKRRKEEAKKKAQIHPLPSGEKKDRRPSNKPPAAVKLEVAIRSNNPPSTPNAPKANVVVENQRGTDGCQDDSANTWQVVEAKRKQHTAPTQTALTALTASDVHSGQRRKDTVWNRKKLWQMARPKASVTIANPPPEGKDLEMSVYVESLVNSYLDSIEPDPYVTMEHLTNDNLKSAFNMRFNNQQHSTTEFQALMMRHLLNKLNTGNFELVLKLIDALHLGRVLSSEVIDSELDNHLWQNKTSAVFQHLVARLIFSGCQTLAFLNRLPTHKSQQFAHKSQQFVYELLLLMVDETTPTDLASSVAAASVDLRQFIADPTKPHVKLVQGPSESDVIQFVSGTTKSTAVGAADCKTVKEVVNPIGALFGMSSPFPPLLSAPLSAPLNAPLSAPSRSWAWPHPATSDESSEDTTPPNESPQESATAIELLPASPNESTQESVPASPNESVPASVPASPNESVPESAAASANESVPASAAAVPASAAAVPASAAAVPASVPASPNESVQASAAAESVAKIDDLTERLADMRAQLTTSQTLVYHLVRMLQRSNCSHHLQTLLSQGHLPS